MFFKFFLCISYQYFLGFFSMQSIYYFILCFILFLYVFVLHFLFFIFMLCLMCKWRQTLLHYVFHLSFCFVSVGVHLHLFHTFLLHCIIVAFLKCCFMALLDNFHFFLALFLGASCWHFFSTFLKLMLLHDLIVQFLFFIFIIYLILCMWGDMFLHCVFCFIFCYANLGVLFAFVSFIFATLHHCWTTSILHCIMYYLFCVDYFIMKSCLAYSLIFFLSFYCVGVVCYGEVNLSPT
jgi:hypothetical protein